MKSLVIRFLAAVAVAAAATGAGAQAMNVEGVKLEPAVQLGATTLQLNGAGLRVKVFFKVYVAGLYMPQKSNDVAALLAQKGARRVAITMLRDVDAESFAGALNDGLRSNHSEAQFAGMKSQIDSLNATLKLVGEAKKGDVIHIEFVPESGTRVTANGAPRGTPIAGEEFFTSLLRVWLGDKPVDASLKKAMVGS